MDTAPLTTLHLHRIGAAQVPAALVRTAIDRFVFARTPGVRFAKCLGCGDGTTFGVTDADLTTWGHLVVWDDPRDLARFEATSPVARGWAAIATDTWRADLRALRSQGSWSGRAPFGPTGAASSDGPVAAITRARLAIGHWRAFWDAVPPVAADLAGAEGLAFRIGIGEAPIGLQGTFSVWRDTTALTDFAYRRSPHREVIDRTQSEGWYAEELFARFALVQATGTLGGVDPLGELGRH